MGGLLLVAIFAFVASAPTPVAQEETEPLGRLFFNATKMDIGDDLACGEVPTYGMNATAPGNTTPNKSYVGRGYFGVACPAYFDYNATEPTQLGGNATVRFALACDDEAPIRSVEDQAASAKAILQKDGEDVASGLWYAPEPLCDPENPFTVNITVDTKETELEPGDHLAVAIYVWAATTEDGAGAENFHILVESEQHEASIRADGLPLGPGTASTPPTPASPGPSTGPAASPGPSTSSTPQPTTVGGPHPSSRSSTTTGPASAKTAEGKDTPGLAAPLAAAAIGIAAALRLRRRE